MIGLTWITRYAVLWYLFLYHLHRSLYGSNGLRFVCFSPIAGREKFTLSVSPTWFRTCSVIGWDLNMLSMLNCCSLFFIRRNSLLLFYFVVLFFEESWQTAQYLYIIGIGRVLFYCWTSSVTVAWVIKQPEAGYLLYVHVFHTVCCRQLFVFKIANNLSNSASLYLHSHHVWLENLFCDIHFDSHSITP